MAQQFLVCAEGVVGYVRVGRDGRVQQAPPGWRWSVTHPLSVLTKWLSTFGEVSVEGMQDGSANT